MADDKNASPENNAASPQESKQKKPDKAAKGSIAARAKKWFGDTWLEYKSEFKKIVWPSRETLIKETITVVVISLIFGAYVTVLDGAFGFLYSMFAQFAATLL